MIPRGEEIVTILDPFAVGGPNPDAQMLFIVDYSQLLINPTFSSYMQNGICSGPVSSFNQRAFLVTEAQFTDDRDDFHILFPPPYRICAADDINCITGP